MTSSTMVTAPRVPQPAYAPSVKFMAAARSTLTTQRAFRSQQLRQLDAVSPGPRTDPARAEIHRSLREAAQSALDDIDAALLRISRGTYTRCPGCGGAISTNRLRALPMAPLCGRCHRAKESWA